MELYDAHLNWANRPADERFASLQDLHKAVSERDKRSSDEVVDLRGASFTVRENRVTMDANKTHYPMTYWSSGQAFQRLGVPREMLKKLDANVASSVLNNRLHKLLNEEEGEAEAPVLLSRTNGAKSDQVIRAWHGDRYGTHDDRIWDSDVTKLLVDELPDGWRNPVAYDAGEWGAPLVPSGLYASDRDLFAFLIDGGDQLDLGGRDQFHNGFFISNSEVGARRFMITRFKFRVVCGNNIVWGAEDVTAVALRHTKKARQRADEFLVNFLRGLETSASDSAFAAAVKRAKEMTFALTSVKHQDAAIESAMKKGFTKNDAVDALTAIRDEEPGAKGSYWDWLQGFTSVARRQPHTNDRVKLELKASRAFLPVGASK